MTTDTDPTAEPDVAHQPTLPAMELPDYHGRTPVGMKTALAGAGTRVTRPHTIGDRIVLVIEARVKSASHEDTDDGLVYSEKLKVLDLFELDADQGSRLISTVRSLYRTGDDAAKGRRPVPGLGDVGYTDASGVVLTPDEVADLRGDPIRVLITTDLTPAVVVYDDGARDLWPDDYPKDAPRPKVGESFLTESGDATVVELLHHATGEPITAPTEPTAVTDDDDEPSNVVPLHPAPTGEIPDLPDAPDPYAGGLDELDEGWEDEVPPRPLTADEIAALEPVVLPTAADFAFVDCQIPELVKKLDIVADLAHARRLVLAERQGRGRGLKPRAGAMKWLDAKVDALAGEATP